MMIATATEGIIQEFLCMSGPGMNSISKTRIKITMINRSKEEFIARGSCFLVMPAFVVHLYL